MSRRVSISLRTARDILEIEESHHGQSVLIDSRVFRGLKELRAAMAPKKSVSASRVRRVAKKATRKDVRAAIRATIEARANGCCEACGISDRFTGPHQWDHFFGRVRVKESAASGWMLCARCHDNKTNNAPSALAWLETFAAHCERHAFKSEERLARSRAEAIELMEKAAGRAASMTRGAP